MLCKYIKNLLISTEFNFKENGLTNPTKETLFAIANALSLTGLETAILFGIDITSYNFAQVRT